jgi:Uma2 family endonuclease
VRKVVLPLKKSDRRYTYADYRTWPAEERWELIDGVAWNMSPAPSFNHQALSAYLTARLYAHFEAGPCRVLAAPFDVLLPGPGEDEEDQVSSVVQPDLTIICEPERITPSGCYGPPTWVIEILSPYTALKDLNQKRELYQRMRIGEYWLFDAAQVT